MNFEVGQKVTYITPHKKELLNRLEMMQFL